MHWKTSMVFVALVGVALAGCDPAEDAQAAPPAKPKVTTAEIETNAEPAPKPVGVTMFDFVDNRHLAHFFDRGLVLDLGHASAVTYVQGRWNSSWYDSVTVDDVKVGYPRGVSGTVRFPVTEAADDWAVQVRLKPVGFQRCDLFFSAANGDETKIGSINEIEDDWGTYRVDLPTVEPGEYTLRLHFSRSRNIAGGRRSAAAIDWIRIGPKADKLPGRRDDAFDADHEAIALSAGQSLTWHTVLGEQPTFQAVAKGKGSLTVAADGLDPTSFDLVGEAAVDLSAFAGKPVRLTLAAVDGYLGLEQPRLTRPHGTMRPRAKGPRVILVWVVDTLRADHLPLYNPKTDVVTPNLDAFAEQAVVFSNATVQGNSSLPTSASIFTGSYTVTHGLVRESKQLKSDHVVLGEPFDAAGWKAGLFSSNGYVSEKWGFARGFDVESNPIRESRPSDTSVLWPEAREWLEGAIEGDSSVLLYINTVDPHVPYDPPDEYLKRYHSGGRVGKVSPRSTGQLLHDAAAGKVRITPVERAYMRALYKGEITDNDAWFGTMREDLETLGISGETMIVITSDHGEEFGEYGRYGHGVSVNQELVDVPFIVGYRPWTQPGRRLTNAVEVIDLFPTIADAAGLDISNNQIQGRSLVPDILADNEGHPTPAFSYHNDFLRSARIGNWKYQLFNGDNDRVYDLTDVDGTWDDENLAGQRPITRRVMRDAMAFQVGFDTEWKKANDGWVNNHSAAAARRLDQAGW